MDLAPFKIGTPDGTGGMAAYHHPHVYGLQDISGMKRLVVAPREGHVDLILQLTDLLSEPFRILYVLVEPIGVKEEDAGRFELEEEMTRKSMRGFFERFREFFEKDARHHVWVSSPTGSVVYDQHDVLYAYGPVLEMEKVLLANGLVPGEVEFPFPHVHRYHDELNFQLEDLLHDYGWRWYPLDTRLDVYR